MARRITNGAGRRAFALVAAAAVAGAAAVLLAALFFTAPAEAQGDPIYTRDFPSKVFAADESCAPIGTISDSADPFLNDDWCRPIGFAPITTLAECETVAAVFNTQYAFSPSLSACFVQVYNPGATTCQVPGVAIGGDLVLTIAGSTSTHNTPNPFVGCGLVILAAVTTPVEPPPMVPGGLNATSAIAETTATTACIESVDVQEDPAAAGLGLGETFVGSDGNRFSITTGGPTCSFTGEGCDAALNLARVDDVKTCLASLDAVVASDPATSIEMPVVPPSVGAASVAPAPVASAPVAPIAPAPVAAAPVAAVQDQLANTGEEHHRGAAFASALIGTGLSVLVLTRLVQGRRQER